MLNTLLTNNVRQTLDQFRRLKKALRPCEAMLLITFAGLLSSPYLSAQQSSSTQNPATDLGLKCFENLATPEFPKTALQRHVDGSVWTWTEVSPQGTIEKIDTQVVSAWGVAPKLLTPAVEKVMRAAKIRPECNGKKVTAVFRFELYGEAIANPKVTSKTDGANLMTIDSQPESAAIVSKAERK